MEDNNMVNNEQTLTQIPIENNPQVQEGVQSNVEQVLAVEPVAMVEQVPPIQTPVAPVIENPVPEKVEQNSEIITSGTATEEEIIIDATKPQNEILDEYEIRKDISDEQKRFKKNIIFIGIIVVLIILFIILMPLIVKQQIL